MVPVGSQEPDNSKGFPACFADIKVLLTAALVIVWTFTGAIILHILHLISHSLIRWLIIVLPWIAVSLYWIYIYSKKQKIIDEHIEEASENKNTGGICYNFNNYFKYYRILCHFYRVKPCPAE